MPELGKSGSVGATGGQLPVATRLMNSTLSQVNRSEGCVHQILGRDGRGAGYNSGNVRCQS